MCVYGWFIGEVKDGGVDSYLRALVAFSLGCCLHRRQAHSSCHWRMPFYNLGCVSVSYRRCCRVLLLVSSSSRYVIVLLPVSW